MANTIITYITNGRAVAAWENDGFRMSMKCSTDGSTDMTRYVLVQRISTEQGAMEHQDGQTHKIRFVIIDDPHTNRIASFRFTRDFDFVHPKSEINAAERFLKANPGQIRVLQREAVRVAREAVRAGQEGYPKQRRNGGKIDPTTGGGVQTWSR